MLRNVCRLAKCAISKVTLATELSLRRYVVFMRVANLCSKFIMCLKMICYQHIAMHHPASKWFLAQFVIAAAWSKPISSSLNRFILHTYIPSNIFIIVVEWGSCILNFIWNCVQADTLEQTAIVQAQEVQASNTASLDRAAIVQSQEAQSIAFAKYVWIFKVT